MACIFWLSFVARIEQLFIKTGTNYSSLAQFSRTRGLKILTHYLSTRMKALLTSSSQKNYNFPAVRKHKWIYIRNASIIFGLILQIGQIRLFIALVPSYHLGCHLGLAFLVFCLNCVSGHAMIFLNNTHTFSEFLRPVLDMPQEKKTTFVVFYLTLGSNGVLISPQSTNFQIQSNCFWLSHLVLVKLCKLLQIHLVLLSSHHYILIKKSIINRTKHVQFFFAKFSLGS